MRREITAIVAVLVIAAAAPRASADTLHESGPIRAAGAGGVGYVSWRIDVSDGTITTYRSPAAGLTDLSVTALDLVPLWLRGDLADLLSRLMPVDQAAIAQAIVDLDDPRLLDEVAYAFAYLSPEQIAVSRAYLDIVVENARWVYDVDPLLDYVTLVDVGTPGVDEDFYTSAEYEVLRSGVATTVSLPREVYYESVVHPVLQDERLLRVLPVEGIHDPSGSFWRSYAFEDDEESSYERPYFLDHPARIEDADLAAMDFGGPAAGTVLTGPGRSYSTVIRDPASGAPVLLEFVGQGGGCCSDTVPNPNGQVLVATIALERAAAAGDDALLVALLGAGPGNRTVRGTMLASSDFSDTVGMRILVVRDRIPYGLSTDPVEDALATLAIAPVDVVDSASFLALGLVTTEAPLMPAAYAKIVVPSDQPLPVYEALETRADDIAEYVRRGGTFEMHGDSTVDWTGLAMPFGIDAAPLDGSSAVSSLEIAGFPLLSEVIEGAAHLWDGERAILAGERALDPGEGAVARVGWWVAQNLPWNVQEMSTLRRDHSLARSVEPVSILYNHYGNCGEIQDLYGAALRTLLVPTMLVGTSLDDHVWNEFTDDGEWHPLQVDWSGSVTQIDNWGVAYDADTGGGKTIKAMISYRGDGVIRNLLGRYAVTEEDGRIVDGDYSRHVTLRPTVVDADGAPVDGARVIVASHHLYDASGWYVGTWGFTGPDGTAEITVGEGNAYAVRIDSPLGTIPAAGGLMHWVGDSEAVAGASFEMTFAYDGASGRPLARMPALDATEVPLPEPDPSLDPLHLGVAVTAGRELALGVSYGFDYTWREPLAGADVDVMVLDEDNYALLEAGSPFEAALLRAGVPEVSLDLPMDPGGQDLYVVVASPARVVNAREVDVQIETFHAPPGEPDDLGELVPEAPDADADGDAGPGSGARGGCGCSVVG